MNLNYRIFGEGEPFVILHGLYGSSDNWVGMARELQNYFRVIVVDLRNHGRSPHSKTLNYDVMADDVLELMNDLQIYSANIMGHSMGGKVALAFAALNPERIKRLVVVDVSVRSYSVADGDVHLAEHGAILRALLKINLSEVDSRNQVDEMLAESIPSERIRAFLLKNLYRDKDKEFRWRLNLNVIYDNIQEVLKGLEQFRLDFQKLTQPVLFIKGGDSLYIQEKDYKLFENYFMNSKVEIIKDASHWVHAEKPKEFLDVVKNFCL